MKKNMIFKEALKKIHERKFVPNDRILLEEGLFILSDWKIHIEAFSIFLQDGFFLGEEKKFDLDDYRDFLSFMISSDLKNYIYSNMNFAAFMKNNFSLTKKEIEELDVILEIPD